MENEYTSIINILKGMKFYSISFKKSWHIFYACSFAEREQIAQDLKKSGAIFVRQLEYAEEIEDIMKIEGFFCVESGMIHKNLKDLAEGLMIKKLANI